MEPVTLVSVGAAAALTGWVAKRVSAVEQQDNQYQSRSGTHRQSRTGGGAFGGPDAVRRGETEVTGREELDLDTDSLDDYQG